MSACAFFTSLPMQIFGSDEEATSPRPTAPSIDYYATAIVNLSQQLTAKVSSLSITQESPTPLPTEEEVKIEETSTPTESPSSTALVQNNDESYQTGPSRTWSYSDNLYSGISGPSNKNPLTYWRYGPQNWGQVRGYELCAAGKAQSPIDIPSQASQTTPDKLSISYQPADLRLMSSEFTFQADVPPSNYIFWNDIPYEMLDFSFHSPAEHSIDGKIFDMEIQFFHQTASGEQIILSVLLKKGAENPALGVLWANLPPPPFNMRSVKQFNPLFLLPTERNGFVYKGSITTPPCFEGITWLVFQTPQELSAKQLLAYHTLFPANARPLQNLQNRALFHTEVKNK